MIFNHLKTAKLVSSCRVAITQLERLATLSKQQFLSDPDKIASAKYHLIVAIEAEVDICQHLIAKNNLRVPEDYSDVFRILVEAGVFSKELLPDLLNMAKFRNRLVHIYWDIDDQMIYEILQRHFKDLKRFLAELSAVIT